MAKTCGKRKRLDRGDNQVHSKVRKVVDSLIDAKKTTETAGQETKKAFVAKPDPLKVTFAQKKTSPSGFGSASSLLLDGAVVLSPRDQRWFQIRGWWDLRLDAVTPGLFISNRSSAEDPLLLEYHGITQIINMAVQETDCPVRGVRYLHFPIEDFVTEDITGYLEEVTKCIKDEEDRGGRTLVHCLAGISRSATVCLAYLLKYRHMSLAGAYMFLKHSRPCVLPNKGFHRQLELLERRERGRHGEEDDTNGSCSLVSSLPDLDDWD
ncbi:dual specificity protein phosphatase 19-like [Branchiostoma floridae]|uniref:Dual specificity protein phosphatase 19-like n=1 Tax=Branchiostoma floridae TaxID=7739 RepID=A0A9J7KLD4_BRAFL|nr:dual specificity protein phosphatase 19-like [Branchiostoma floridae]